MSLRGKITLVLIVIILAFLVIGVTYLAVFNIPAPSTKVEKTLPDDRFPK